MQASSQNDASSTHRRESPVDENVLDGLLQGAATNDAGLITRASHILSASAAAVGAGPLSARCKELEAISRTGVVSDAAVWIKLIQRLYVEAESALRAGCVGR